MFHHYRAYREIPAEDWRALHESYAKAEELEVSEEPVRDFLNRDVHETSPRIAYARAVLMHMSNPNELAQRQLTLSLLLERWAAKLEVLRDPIDEGDGLPLVADLAGERCPERVAGAPPQARAGIRYLDARKLAKSLKNRVGLLRKGESPAQLSLGEDCVQPSCEQLLVFLFRQWCQPKAARVERRRRPMPRSSPAACRPSLRPLRRWFERCAWLRPRGVAARGRERAGPAHGATRRQSGRAPQPRSAGRRAPGRGEELHAGPGALADGCRQWRSLCRRAAVPVCRRPSRACHRPQRAERQIPARAVALESGRGSIRRRPWRCRLAGTSRNASSS